MISLDGTTVLVEVLDRQFTYLLDQEQIRMLLHLPRFLGFLRAEPRLAALLDDFGRETNAALDELSSEDEATRTRLRELWISHESRLKAALGDAVHDEKLGVYWPFDKFLAGTNGGDPIELTSRNAFEQDPTRSGRLIKALRNYSQWATSRTKDADDECPEWLLELGFAITDLEVRHRHLLRTLRIAAVTLPGPAMTRLKGRASSVNPIPTPETEGETTDEGLGRQVGNLGAEKFATLLHDPQARLNAGQPTHDGVDVAEAEVRNDLRLLYTELRVRLGLCRSRQVIVGQFTTRCTWYDAERLREICKKDSKRAERLLTLEFGRFLFDHGLVAVLNPEIGEHKPDLLGDLLYVEAKQYSDGSPKSLISAAARQVWSTWQRLREATKIDEAFLLVFRVGGRLVTMPTVVEHRGLRLFPVLVDIAPPAQSGSREEALPLAIDDEDLLPEKEL